MEVNGEDTSITDLYDPSFNRDFTAKKQTNTSLNGSAFILPNTSLNSSAFILPDKAPHLEVEISGLEGAQDFDSFSQGLRRLHSRSG